MKMFTFNSKQLQIVQILMLHFLGFQGEKINTANCVLNSNTLKCYQILEKIELPSKKISTNKKKRGHSLYTVYLVYMRVGKTFEFRT